MRRHCRRPRVHERKCGPLAADGETVLDSKATKPRMRYRNLQCICCGYHTAAVDEPIPLLASRAQYVIDYTVQCILRWSRMSRCAVY